MRARAVEWGKRCTNGYARPTETPIIRSVARSLVRSSPDVGFPASYRRSPHCTGEGDEGDGGGDSKSRPSVCPGEERKTEQHGNSR